MPAHPMVQEAWPVLAALVDTLESLRDVEVVVRHETDQPAGRKPDLMDMMNDSSYKARLFLYTGSLR